MYLCINIAYTSHIDVGKKINVVQCVIIVSIASQNEYNLQIIITIKSSIINTYTNSSY